MNDFWDPVNFDLHDHQNEILWRESPSLQRTIQPPETLRHPDSIGPQQAMLDPHMGLNLKADDLLPWVPDLVGKEFGQNGIMVVGSAYAGFIREYSGRCSSMPLADYVDAARSVNGLEKFQRKFLHYVVSPDTTYYGPLAMLFNSLPIPASQILLTDLCPNSLVKRRIFGSRRQDCSKQPCKDRAQTFCLYAENPTVMDWQWTRIQQTTGCLILALGHLAEHGLLRLFNKMGADVQCSGAHWKLTSSNPPWAWVDMYADNSKKLSSWLTKTNWWEISHSQRKWLLLPIYHPAGVASNDPNYRDTAELLSAALAAAQEF